MALKKLSINMEEKLIEKIDSYAESIGVSRTAALSFLCTQGLQVAFYPEMLDKLHEVSKNV